MHRRAFHSGPVPSKLPDRVDFRRNAFTLIEVLMVLLILLMLIGLILGLSRHALMASQKAQAIADLGELHHGISRFFSEHEAYPDPETDDAVAVTDIWLELPAWAAEEDRNTMETNRWTLLYYLPRNFSGIDPWGNPYQYGHSANAPLSYSLFSLGSPTNDPNAHIYFQP